MSNHDEPLLDEEYVYLDTEAAEFGMQEIDLTEDPGGLAPTATRYPEEMPDELFDEDGELLLGEDGDRDERR